MKLLKRKPKYNAQGKRICTRCGSDRFERVLRDGFVQTHIMPFFHRYPWRCVICNLTIYRPMRRNSEDPADWR
jgi:hypothetical protein